MLNGLLRIIIIQAAIPVIGFWSAKPNAAVISPAKIPKPVQEPM